MFFKKKNTKKIDKLVTGIIIGGAVAGMVGLSQTKKGKEITKEAKTKGSKLFSGGYNVFSHALVKVASLFDKKKK